MKNTSFFIPFLLLFLFCSLSSLKAQTTLLESDGETKTFSYQMLVEAPMYKCDILGNRVDSVLHIAPKGAVFTKIDTKDSDIIIRFWLWHKDEGLMDKLNYTDSTRREKRFFLLSTEEFNEKAIPKHSMKPTFSIGSSVIPLRIRVSPFDFSSEFSFGTSFGAKFRLSPYQDASLNAVFGLHITSITLDSLDTEGAISSAVPTNQVALTPAIGLILEFSKAQIGFYTGWDLINGTYKDEWIYQGKPWMSLGVGFSLFSNQSSTVSYNGQENQQ